MFSSITGKYVETLYKRHSFLMHVLFYYHLAAAATLWTKYPHVGVVSGLPLMYLWGDDPITAWVSIAGAICGFVVHKKTNTLIDWSRALSLVLTAYVAFYGTELLRIPPTYVVPFMVAIEWWVLPKVLFRYKTGWMAFITIICLYAFPYDLKSQLNLMASQSLFLMCVTIMSGKKKE